MKSEIQEIIENDLQDRVFYVKDSKGELMSGSKLESLLDAHFYNADGTKKENPAPLKLNTRLSAKVPEVQEIDIEQ